MLTINMELEWTVLSGPAFTQCVLNVVASGWFGGVFSLFSQEVSVSNWNILFLTNLV